MTDISETIARWRERLRCVPDHEVIDLEVTGREANVLLDAAEAGARARDAALEECEQIAATFVRFAEEKPEQQNVHRLTAVDILDAIRTLKRNSP